MIVLLSLFYRQLVLNMNNEWNVEKRHKQKFDELVEKFVNVFTAKFKAKPYELRDVAKFLLKKLVPNDWCLGFGYLMMFEEQTGEMLEKSVFALFGITREFQGEVLTDEQLKQVARIALISQYNDYSGRKSFIESVKRILGDDVIVFALGKENYIFWPNGNNFVMRVCKEYNFLPAQIGAKTIYIVGYDPEKTYFFIGRHGMHPPKGFMGFPQDPDATSTIAEWLTTENYFVV